MQASIRLTEGIGKREFRVLVQYSRKHSLVEGFYSSPPPKGAGNTEGRLLWRMTDPVERGAEHFNKKTG